MTRMQLIDRKFLQSPTPYTARECLSSTVHIVHTQKVGGDKQNLNRITLNAKPHECLKALSDSFGRTWWEPVTFLPLEA